jgi:hypothetical protein
VLSLTKIDSQERLSFLTAVANKVNNPDSQDAYVYATVAVATVKLELKDLEGSRKDLDTSEKILDGFDSVETIVHAAFYRVSAEYHQVCLSTIIQDLTNGDSPNLNLPRITKTPFFTWHAST